MIASLLLSVVVQETAVDLSRRAGEAYAEGRPAEAISIFRRLRELHPTSEEAEYARTMISRYDGCVPGPPEARDACVRVMSGMQRSGLLTRERVQDTRTAFAEVASKHPGTIEGRYASEFADRLDSMSVAMEEMEGPSVLGSLARFLFGSFIGWWILIVLVVTASAPVYRVLHLMQEKRRLLRSEGAKLSNPQNAEARYKLAEIYLRGGRKTKAEVYAREAIRIAEESPLYDGVPHRFLALLGDVLYRRRRYVEAVESYSGALKAKSDLGYAEVHLSLGRCALRMGDPGRALEHLEQSLRERSSTPETYFRIAQASVRAGRIEEAVRVRREFAEMASKLPSYARRGLFRWRLAFWTFPLSRRML